MTWLQTATGLPTTAFALTAALTLGAAAIRGLTGFGMAIILVPLLGMVMRPDEAVVLAIFLQLLIGPVGLGTSIAASHKPSALPIAALAVLATPLGVWLLARTAPDLARVLIAAIAIGAFIAITLTRKQVAIPGRAATGAVGVMAGVLTGFAAMPGPPVVPFYLREAFTPATARASMLVIFFATASAGTLASVLLGLGSARLAWLSILLFPAVLLGNWLGGLAFGKISPLLWRSGVALLLGVAGLSAVLRLLP
jgi:uncharacterized protein